MKIFKEILIKLIIANLIGFFVWQPVVYAQSTNDRDLTSSSGTAPIQRGNYEHVSVPSLSEGESKANIYNLGTQNNPQNLGDYPRIKVHILGEVGSPGVYVMSVSDRLTDALKFGVPKRTSQRIVQIRHPGEKTRFFDLYHYYHNGNLDQNPYLKDNDVIFVSKHNGAVRVEGPVARPGLYELSYEKNLLQIIQLAGDQTTAASKIQPIKIIRFSEGGKKFVLDVENTPKELKRFKIDKGDIIVVPDMINNPKDFDYKVETIPGENHFYPTATPSVFVVGQVSQPGPFPYKSHLQVRDYVAYAGPAQTANMRYVTLVRHGKRKKVSFDNKLHSGDIIMVKGKINYGLVVGSLSTVLSLTLTSLLVENTLRSR